MEDIGLKPSMRGGLSPGQFVRFRERVEQEQPLTPELEQLRMGFLPHSQRCWLSCKRIVQEMIDFRESRKPASTRRADNIDGE